MRQVLAHRERQELLNLLVDRDEMVRGSQAASFEEAAQALKQIQIKAKRRFREIAMDWHPDRTGGDARKAELLARLSTLHDELQELVPIELPNPSLSRMVVTITCSSGGFPIL